MRLPGMEASDLRIQPSELEKKALPKLLPVTYSHESLEQKADYHGLPGPLPKILT